MSLNRRTLSFKASSRCRCYMRNWQIHQERLKNVMKAHYWSTNNVQFIKPDRVRQVFYLITSLPTRASLYLPSPSILTSCISLSTCIRVYVHAKPHSAGVFIINGNFLSNSPIELILGWLVDDCFVILFAPLHQNWSR